VVVSSSELAPAADEPRFFFSFSLVFLLRPDGNIHNLFVFMACNAVQGME
jgi:hypothetical protein